MRILKFGGSSVANSEAIRQVRKIIVDKLADHRLAVVVSAFGGVTDLLEEAVVKAAEGDESYSDILDDIEARHNKVIKELLSIQKQSRTLAQFKMMFNELDDVLHGVSLTRELTDRTRDFVLGFGERFSAFIISQYLSDKEINAGYLDARKIIKTDKRFGSARVLTEETYPAIREYYKKLDEDSVQVVTGFIASTLTDEATTLGRGGSDYTASLLGAALKAEAIELWTDIEGIMTADPRKVKRYFVIPQLSYEEAMELSHFGAKVVYPPTMQPAMKVSIPILIKNTFKPEQEGTTISAESRSGESSIKGISSIDNVTLLTIRGSGMIGVTGVASRIFSALADAGVNIIMITQASSEHTVCLAVLPSQAEAARESIEQEFKYELNDGVIDEILVEHELSIVAIVGDDMRHTPGISGRVFQSLGRNGINVVAIAQGSSERNISVVVERKNETKTLNTLHDAFFLSRIKTVNLFLVGVGLIGGTLLKLIRKQTQKLLDDYFIDLKLAGVSNSKKFLIDEEGISMEHWKDELDENGESADIEKFIEQMSELNLSNSIFIDCTASDEIANTYSNVLKSSVSIVTANKKANSSSLSKYEELQELALQHNVAYLYETNVGAGLPVVATLKEQILTGDSILKIEGVFSGTLSYIFNTFDGSEPFSQVVRTAREKGFTEPDPREDLNGQDVGRKLLILAREAGLKLEFENIDIQNLVPEPAREVPTVEEFFDILEDYDDEFQELYEEAQSNNNKLCYIARYEDGQATVKLEQIGAEHPFYGLKGSDNIIAFKTQHYEESPIVVKGPGAGANVTASGIIADILRISNAPSFGKEY
ncbi:bifunctional aspartate kinase/homoserine dehydrogenase I [Aliifodinibius sp. S!AR15-10]|uniref:bifunctional aspartate kinase/homoserine dehydrogenase I n=1 Tax=Aliifodinibius sp. S!AR15-10 TaxID=2950437 RepID=UPI00285C1FD1|nr:bifunctional aspartate kinase/homoserine dehydrogenase I [Aliifodinibius sp. S!AR15-10]MDR8392165.1 bifunctional aspartate kinase/homoserine dehydrogenase I [Aliifodinibius sp. S!AR15-10]